MISSNVLSVSSTPSPIFAATSKHTQVIVKALALSGVGVVLGGSGVSLVNGYALTHPDDATPVLILNPGDVLYARSLNQDSTSVCILVVE